MAITELDRLIHDTGANMAQQAVCQMDATHYVKAYRGGDLDGFVATFSVSADGTTITEIEQLEFNTTRADIVGLCKVDATHFAVAWVDNSDDLKCSTFSIDGSFGSITLINTLNVQTGTATAPYTADGLKLIATNRLVLACQELSLGATVWTLSINASTYAVTELNELSHDSIGGDSSVDIIDSTHFIVAYRGTANDGFVATFSVNGSYVITEIASLEHDTANGYSFVVRVIDATHFAIRYADLTNVYLKTFSMDGSFGTLTQIDSEQIDTAPTDFEGKGGMTFMNKTGDANLFAITWNGDSEDGFIRTATIDGSYLITVSDDLFEFDTVSGKYMYMFPHTENIVVVGYVNDTDGAIMSTFDLGFGSVAYSMVASVGAFTLTGITNALKIGKYMAAATGVFTLTGISNVLNLGRKMSVTVGTFTLTGFDAILMAGKRLVAETGTFVVTGIDIIFRNSLTMINTVGSFVLTGFASGLYKGYGMLAELGTFTLTGIDTGLKLGIKMAVTVGTLTLTGIDILFKRGYAMAVTVGVFALTGIDTALKIALKMAVTVGSFVLTGIDVTLKKGYGVIAEVGTFALSGVAVTFKLGWKMVATTGVFTLTGYTSTLFRTGWQFLTKTLASLTAKTKHSATLTAKTKNTRTWTDRTRN